MRTTAFLLGCTLLLLLAGAGGLLAACGSKVPDLPAPTVSGTIAFWSVGGDVRVVRTDGTVVGTLENPKVNEFDPAWSPDAARIAYSIQGGMGGRTDVVVANAEPLQRALALDPGSAHAQQLIERLRKAAVPPL